MAVWLDLLTASKLVASCAVRTLVRLLSKEALAARDMCQRVI
jgi:hypothetical protein